MTDDCVFCKIIKGEIPKKFEYEDTNVVAFYSNKPSAEIHLLIIPKKHIPTFLELDKEIVDMTKVAQKIIKDMNLGGGYRLCFNGGKYLEVQHVHLHLLAGKIDSYT
jgi:histidine triad (HIT) family protein